MRAISIFSLVIFILNLTLHAQVGAMQGGVIRLLEGPPNFDVMGVSFGTIIGSLFTASLFTTLERMIRVWEDYKKANGTLGPRMQRESMGLCVDYVTLE